MKFNSPKTPDVCPSCGEEVPPGALACPECGADHNSGWREEASVDSLDLPDPDFDYTESVRREFGNSPKPHGIKTIWWITGILVFVALAALFLLTAR